MKQLEKGDIIYRKHYRKITHRIEIERVTKTLAVASLGASGMFRFKREYEDNGYVREKQDARFSTSSYYIETPKLKEEWQKEEIILKLEKTNFRELSLKKLSQLCTLL